MGRPAVFALACAVAAIAAACSSPAVRFYTLSSVAKPVSATADLSIAVGPVSVPPLVDRAQIVVTTGTNQVSFDQFNRWASPLEDDIALVVAEDLATMLGTARVTLLSSSPGAEVDYRVQIEVRNFESSPGKEAALDAVWRVWRTKDGKSQSGRSSAREPVQQDGFDALAAAHSRAVAKLSQDIAAAVRTLEGTVK